MLDDRDEKYEPQEEDGEYHFTEEEVNYEAEPAEDTQATKAVPRENILNRLTRSKRMLISLGVFLVLIFVVYKMIAPTSLTPPSDITPTPEAPTPVSTREISSEPPITQPNVRVPSQTTSIPVPSGQPMTSLPPQPAPTLPAVGQGVPASQNAPNVAAPLPPMQQPSNTMVQPQTQQPIQPPVVQTSPSITPPTAAPLMPPMAPPQPQPSAVQQPQTIPQASTTPLPQDQTGLPYPQQQQTQTQMNNMQQPYPVNGQANVPPAVSGQMPMVPNTNQSFPGNIPYAGSLQTPSVVDEGLANLKNTNERLMAQLQSEYVQRLSEFNAQNKTLQSQVSALNARVANMEEQMNKLIHMLMNQRVREANPPAPPPVMEVQPPISNVSSKVSYNVQAIIPGRAWLRSETGETVTVAEGDVIKDLGRVIKIDPYDGIVEVNTGNKVLSLAYGTQN